MDIRTFRSEITDRLGSGQAVSALNAAFAAGNELLHSASEIRLRTGLPLLVIGGLRKEKYFLAASGRIVSAQSAYLPSKDEVNRIFASICRSSVYAYKEDIRNGFITLRGGHRVRFAPQNRLFESADCKDINIQKNLLNFIKNAYIFFVFSFP